MEKVAVLVSGGMDSCVLVSELLSQGYEVYPVYIEHGMIWESVEKKQLEIFLQAIATPELVPLKILLLPVVDIYDAHWSLSGEGVPDESTEDEAVYLPGRNLLLLAKVSVWCQGQGIHTIALAPLKANPFSDNTDAFYSAMCQSIDIALQWPVKIIRPFVQLTKAEVLKKGEHLPLQLTFSCIQPINGLHCGRCNKCAERHAAYQALGMDDNTVYYV